jgi:hypothetical protein
MEWWEAWHQEVLDQTTVQMAHWSTLELKSAHEFALKLHKYIEEIVSEAEKEEKAYKAVIDAFSNTPVYFEQSHGRVD